MIALPEGLIIYRNLFDTITERDAWSDKQTDIIPISITRVRMLTGCFKVRSHTHTVQFNIIIEQNFSVARQSSKGLIMCLPADPQLKFEFRVQLITKCDLPNNAQCFMHVRYMVATL